MTNTSELLADRLEAGSALYDPQDRKLAVAALRAFASPSSDVDIAKIGRDSANRIMALRHTPPSDVGGRSDMAMLADVQTLVERYREAWRDAIDQKDSEAFARENSDGSDHNLQALDRVFDFIAALRQSTPSPGEITPDMEHEGQLEFDKPGSTAKRVYHAMMAAAPAHGRQDEREAIARECKADMYALWCDSCNAHPSACPLLSRSPAPVNGAMRAALEKIAAWADIKDPETNDRLSGEESMYGEGVNAGLRSAGQFARSALAALSESKR